MAETATVTLLFTDLAGSTELLGRLGEDGAEDLRHTHFALLREAAAAHDGREVKTLGDGLMVAFGSALSGVACAVAMQRRVADHNERHPERQLGLRVGVNAGEAVSEEHDYFGTPVVIAKRLCDRADPGRILISQVVRVLVGNRDGFDFQDLGALSLKGLADPVPACDVVWDGRAVQERRPPVDEPAPRGSSADARPAALKLPAALSAEVAFGFVGRAADLERLSGELEHARRGRMRLVLIAGEPGVGKSRLAAEFVRRAHADGVSVLYGRCDEEAIVPFQPFVQALEHYVGHAPVPELQRLLADDGGELTRLLPALRRRLPDVAQPAGGDPAAERYRMFEATRALLYGIARDRPTILLLDDLHWAEKPTLLLLAHLMRSTEQAPLLIVGSYRDVELTRSHPLAETLGDLRRERLFERLDLKGLGEDEVRALIAAWAGQEPPADFTRAVWQETEGHPFFAQELLRHLLETGAIREKQGRLTPRTSLKRMGVPEGIREVISRRLARLDEETGRVLGVAAVIGREFAVELLERVCEVTGEHLFELLEQAAAAQVIIEAPLDGSYAFSHTLIRDTLYDDLTTPHRVRLHQRIGQAVEELHDADRDGHLGELAHHYFEAAAGAEALEKAIEYATAAGRRDAAQLAYEEAAIHLEQAVRGLALRGGDDARRCRLLVELGENQFNAGEFNQAQQSFRQAGELADRLGLADELASAALGFGGGLSFDVGVIDPVLISLLERSLARLGGEDGFLRARVLARLAEALAISPQRERAAALRGEAVRMAERLGDARVRANVLAQSMWAHAGPDNVSEQQALADEIVELAEETNDSRTMADGYAWRLGSSFCRGDLAAADAALKAYSRLAEQSREPYQLWQSALFTACRAFVDQPLGEIERLVWRALEIGQATQNPSALQAFGAQILFIRVLQGRAAELRAGFEGFTAFSPQLPAFRCALAWVYCEMGREDDARTELERLAVNDFGDLPRDVFWLTCMELLADVCAHLGDERRAVVLYQLLSPYEDHFVVVGEFGTARGVISRQLGLLAATLSRFDEAANYFESALADDRCTGSLVALAKTRCDYAAMLIARDRTGDRDRALALAHEARDAAERLEIPRVLEQATALGLRAAGEAVEPQTGSEGSWLAGRASLIASEAKAALSTRGRDTVAKLLGETSDEDLERRFGSTFAQRALFTAMTRAFQPRLALGFEGEIAYELIHAHDSDVDRASDWWTVRIERGRAVARHRTAHDPAVTVHAGIPEFVRIFSGEHDPVGAMLEGRIVVDGDLVLGARLAEMFGSVSPSEVLANPA